MSNGCRFIATQSDLPHQSLISHLGFEPQACLGGSRESLASRRCVLRQRVRDGLEDRQLEPRGRAPTCGSPSTISSAHCLYHQCGLVHVIQTRGSSPRRHGHHGVQFHHSRRGIIPLTAPWRADLSHLWRNPNGLCRECKSRFQPARSCAEEVFRICLGCKVQLDSQSLKYSYQINHSDAGVGTMMFQNDSISRPHNWIAMALRCLLVD